MPAFLTHWHILIETTRRTQDAGNELGSLIIDAATLLRRAHGWATPPQTTPAGAVWDTGPLPEINFRFPGSDISSMAYLGALSPDIFSFRTGYSREKASDRLLQKGASHSQIAGNHVPWAKLLHAKRSGDVLLAFLELIAHVPSPALRSQALAFAMGYLSHIATDIALNPWINALAAAYPDNNSMAMHTYVELRLDQYLADVYFNHTRYSLSNQPWGRYIEPAVRSISANGTLSQQILHLLAAAAEMTYGLEEEQTTAFSQDYLAGLQGLRRYLAGRGRFRLAGLYQQMRRRSNYEFIATFAGNDPEQTMVSLEAVLSYATRLSELLCRRAISYYSALRNVQASASERSSRRAALRDVLRNWNLETGYTMDMTFDEEVTLRLLHNWVHFADLWEMETVDLSEANRSVAN
jgi:hypothetical protein